MHEYSVMQQLVESLVDYLSRNEERRVEEVHLMRGSGFAEDPLLLAYEILTTETLLEGSKLIIEPIDLKHTCRYCWKPQEVEPYDLIGHLFVCPACGAPQPIEEAQCLEVSAIKFAGEEELTPCTFHPAHEHTGEEPFEEGG